MSLKEKEEINWILKAKKPLTYKQLLNLSDTCARFPGRNRYCSSASCPLFRWYCTIDTWSYCLSRLAELSRLSRWWPFLYSVLGLDKSDVITLNDAFVSPKTGIGFLRSRKMSLLSISRAIGVCFSSSDVLKKPETVLVLTNQRVVFLNLGHIKLGIVSGIGRWWRQGHGRSRAAWACYQAAQELSTHMNQAPCSPSSMPAFTTNFMIVNWSFRLDVCDRRCSRVSGWRGFWLCLLKKKR